jgi:NADH-quinone oxidoreductase subunit N
LRPYDGAAFYGHAGDALVAFLWNDLFAMAPQAILIAGGLAILTAQLMLRTGQARMAWQVGLLTLACAIVVTIFGLKDANGLVTLLPRAFLGFENASALGGNYLYTAYSANAILLFLVLSFAAVLIMGKITGAAGLAFAETYFLLLMSVTGYSYAVCSEDFITLFVGLELGSLPLLVLIGLNRGATASNEAALKYLLLSAFAIAFLLLGIALIYGATGTMRMRELREIGPHFTRTRMMLLGTVCIFAGFFFKLSAVPLHSYVADVYEGSTTVFTGILASLSKAAAALILMKVNLAIHDGFRAYLAPVLMAAAIASMFVGALASLATDNIKRILGYSSVANAGFILCFFIVPAAADYSVMGALKQEAGSALYGYVVGYALASLAAFGAVAILERRLPPGETVSVQTLAEATKSFPFARWILALSVLSFMGMPPLAGFFGKFFLFKYTALSNNLPLAAAAAVSSAVSVYAYIRILRPLFFSDESAPVVKASPAFNEGEAARWALILLACGVCFFAVFSSFLYTSGITATSVNTASPLWASPT